LECRPVDLIRLPFFSAEKGKGVSPAIGEATILALVRACVVFTRPLRCQRTKMPYQPFG
jgi:hypothetical protein